MRPSKKSHIILFITFGIFIQLAPTPIQAQCDSPIAVKNLDTRELLTHGVQAYNALPSNGLGLRDAKCFSDAVSYLFAYEQRLHQNNQPTPDDVGHALTWLSDRLDVFKVGKGDFQLIPALYQKGLDAEKKVIIEQNQIWDIQAYISASANLYAYLQIANPPKKKAKNKFAQLQRNKTKLVVAGGKGDFAKEPDRSWMPAASSKPQLGGNQTFVIDTLITFGEMPVNWNQNHSIEVNTENSNSANDAVNEEHPESERELRQKYESLLVRYQFLKRKVASLETRIRNLEQEISGQSSFSSHTGDKRYDIILTSSGTHKIEVIKQIRSITGLGLKESKDLVDETPSIILKDVSKEKATEMKQALEQSGAVIKLRLSRDH